MPYTAKNVPSNVKTNKAKWAKIWNAAYKYAKNDGKSDKDAEAYAFATANAKYKDEGKNGLDLMGHELRFMCEMRAEGGAGDSDPLRLEGYAAKFNTWSQDLGGFFETIKPGAFDRVIDEKQDVRALMNHDPNIVLGRTKAGTLRLKVDSVGLFYRCELPDTQMARDLHTSVKRGDIDQCSFAFKVRDGGDRWYDDKLDDGTRIAKRELLDLNVFDVSAVTYPAYLDTNVAARHEGRHAWSEVVPQEIRSLIETREDEDSYEELLTDISQALAEAFPHEANKVMDGPYYNGGKYWVIETYTDSVIVCEAGTDNYFRIPYTHDENAEAEDEEIKFGSPTPVEKEWVPSGRAQKSIALYRASKVAPVTEDKAKVDTNEARPDPAATKVKTEGVAMPDPVPNNPQSPNDPGAAGPQLTEPSPKYVKAQAAAKKAAAHAAVKATKVAYMQAKMDMEQCGPEPAAKAAADAKVAAAHAAFKQAKSDHIAAAESEAEMKAKYAAQEKNDFEEISEMEPGECDCAHCRSGLIDCDDPDDDTDMDCTDPSCPCQNRWSVGGDDGMGGGPRAEAKASEVRWNDPDYYEKRDGKVRTKRVGGKDLTAKNFAYVGDPDKTETWKLPIHDAAHVRNALARFNQTKGIPAGKKSGVYRKIVNAAKKFGIEVSDEKNSFPADEDEIALMRARARAKASTWE